MPNEIEKRDILPPASAAGEMLAMQGEMDVESLEKIVNQRVDFYRKIALISLKLTSVHDWVDAGGKPYLQASGAQKLMKLWGVTISDTKMEMEMNLESGMPLYRFTGRVQSKVLGLDIEIMGGRNANDTFFTSQAKVDLLDVQKAAYNNFLGRAVKSVIGLSGLTWEEIAEMTQGRITQGKATGKVSYNTKPPAQPAHPAAEMPPHVEAQAKSAFPPEIVELQKLVLQIGTADPSQTPDGIINRYFKIGDKCPTYQEVSARFRTPKQLGWVKKNCERIRKDFSTVLPADEPELFPEGE